MTPNRNALRVLAGDGFSAFGAWIDFLAILTLAAWQFQVSPLQMAAVTAAGLAAGWAGVSFGLLVVWQRVLQRMRWRGLRMLG